MAREIANQFGASNAQFEILLWYRGPKIGDMQMALRKKEPGVRQINVIDFGSVYGGIPSEYKTLTGKASSSEGISRGLKTGELPLHPGLYWEPYILDAARNWPELWSNSAEFSVSYARAELVKAVHDKRLSFEDLKATLGEDHAKSLMLAGEKDIKKWYGSKDAQILAGEAVLSHAHDDHIGSAPYLRSSYISTYLTAGYLGALSVRDGWQQDFKELSYLSLKPRIKNRYQTEQRPMRKVYKQGEKVKLDSGATATFYWTDHSIRGSAMIGIEAPSGGKFLFSGDIRPGELTDEAIDLAAKEKYQIILWENTNSLDSRKASSGVTQETVYDNILQVMRGKQTKGKLIVVMVSSNHQDRLATVYEAAHAAHRTVVVGSQMASTLDHLMAETKIAPKGSVQKDWFLPEIGSDLWLWSPSRLSPSIWQKKLEERAGSYLANINNLQNVSGDIVLVLSPYDSLMRAIGNANVKGLSVIYSAPFPYGADDKGRVAALYDFTTKVKEGRWYADFDIYGDGGRVVPQIDGEHAFHWSGHASFQENMELLSRVAQKGSKVYFVHGSHPEKYAADAVRWFAQYRKNSGVIFTGTLNHYEHSSPIAKQGHIIEL